MIDNRKRAIVPVAVCWTIFFCTPSTAEEAQVLERRQWRTRAVRTVREAIGPAGIGDVELGQYGGLREQTVRATGFFRTQQEEGRWWLIDSMAAAGGRIHL